MHATTPRRGEHRHLRGPTFLSFLCPPANISTRGLSGFASLVSSSTRAVIARRTASGHAAQNVSTTSAERSLSSSSPASVCRSRSRGASPTPPRSASAGSATPRQGLGLHSSPFQSNFCRLQFEGCVEFEGCLEWVQGRGFTA